MELLSYVVGDSNDENNFSHTLSLTNIQVLRLHEAFANGSSANIKLSKTLLHEIGQSGRFLDRLLRPLLKDGFPLTKTVLKLLAKSVIILLRLTAATSATDAPIHKKIFGSITCPSDLAKQSPLTISNEEMSDIMKIVKSGWRIWIINKIFVSRTIKNEAKEQKGRFLGMFIGTLGKDLIRAGEGTIRGRQGF